MFGQLGPTDGLGAVCSNLEPVLIGWGCLYIDTATGHQLAPMNGSKILEPCRFWNSDECVVVEIAVRMLREGDELDSLFNGLALPVAPKHGSVQPCL